MASQSISPHTERLVSVYDETAFSEANFQRELNEVHVLTAPEREWIELAGLQAYDSDEQILDEAAAGRLVRISEGAGFIARQFLRDWTPERSDPSHEFYYSPPFLRSEAAEVLSEIGGKVSAEIGASRLLSVTSLVRSVPYQQHLATKKRKLTIAADGLLSSHQVGLAFDIDGCGIVEEDDAGARYSINPRAPGYRSSLVIEARSILRDLLIDRKRDGQLNFVEELPGTQEHVFHVAVKPQELL